MVNKERKAVEIREIMKAEGLVEVVSDSRFSVAMEFCKYGLDGAIAQCYIRKEVYDKLCRVQITLRDGWKIKIYDAWRPYLVQRELFTSTYSRLELANRGMSKEDLLKLASECVTPHRQGILREFPHSTGGAVDIGLVDSSGLELDMGTDYNEFNMVTRTDYFESKENRLMYPNGRGMCENRRLLLNTMESVGFVNNPAKWWHFSYGDTYWSNLVGMPPIYDGILIKK